MIRSITPSALLVALAFCLVGCDAQRVTPEPVDRTTQASQPVDIDTLLSWPAYGRGSVEPFRGNAVILREDPGSAGLMIVSPDAYGDHIVLKYRALTLQPGTVLVAILSASDPGDAEALSLPDGYDGEIGPWVRDNTNYFFAFHNAPHLRHPFVTRAGDNGMQLLQEAERNHMSPGRWHDIEVGRHGGRLWLSIDGERILDTTDDTPYGPGRLALRIRGTGPEVASAMIRDLHIQTE